MYILTSKDCAWRAIYVYSGKRGTYGANRFSIGIDPTHPRGAQLFGSLGFRRDCTGGRKASWHWRIPLPKSRFWHLLDGRRA